MKHKIVAVTACTTGVAHTYLAAQALKKGAKKLNHLIKVETQGATGIDNPLTEKDINIGEVVIFAVDTKVRGEERFTNKKVYRVSVNEPIKDAEAVIEEALKLIETD